MTRSAMGLTSALNCRGGDVLRGRSLRGDTKKGNCVKRVDLFPSEAFCASQYTSSSHKADYLDEGRVFYGTET